MEQVVILSAGRTPIGKYKGSLAGLSASELGAHVIKAVIERSEVPYEDVNQVIMGNVLSAGQGQNVARQAAVKAGLSYSVPATSINEVCGSGLKAIIMAKQLIQLGEAQVVVAGGVESMSQAPRIQKYNAETEGYEEPVNSMIYDGLTDAFSGKHMGLTAEKVAERYGITREEQDAYAYESQMRAVLATAEERFAKEIVPVPLADGRMLTEDESIRGNTTVEKLASLKPAFLEAGTVTAGNASAINDGGAALVLASKSYALTHGLDYLAELGQYSEVGIDPQFMGVAPIQAIQQLLEKEKLQLKDIDLFEINEAFAAASLAVLKTLGLDQTQVNVNGGGISLGHPIGASGARIVTTLLYELIRQEKQQGVASLCIGGGLGLALSVKRPQLTSDGKKFYQLNQEERLAVLTSKEIVTAEQQALLMNEMVLPEAIAANLIENQIGEIELPLGILPELLVNQQLYHVPMATEEPSVIAAASNGAKMVRSAGGFSAEILNREMLGQVVFIVKDTAELSTALQSRSAELIQIANESYPSIVKRGGGTRSVEIREFAAGYVSLDIKVDVCDAMGANIVNSILEGIAAVCHNWFPDTEILFSILSNYATESLVKVHCTIPVAQLATKTTEGLVVAERIAAASAYSQLDPYRAVTHNKGIMNGVDAVVLATGNDTRAIAAGCHAYAAKAGSYQGLSTWQLVDQELVGQLVLPLPIATVGGATKVLPKAAAALDILNTASAKELAQVIAAVGLAQNLAALKALVTEGIQRGHMSLQMRSLALSVGAADAEVPLIAEALNQEPQVNRAVAERLLAEIRNK